MKVSSMKWENRFSVGVKVIDDQHKKLVALISEIEYLHKQDSIDVKQVAGVLQELKKYTLTHFSEEEEVMERHGFVGLERHKKLHQEFIDKVELFESMFDKGPKQVLDIMLPFLSKWLGHHILVEDKRYSKNVDEKFKL